MANTIPPAFDPSPLVQQATQAMQSLFGQPWAQAKSMQPLMQAFAHTANVLAADPQTQLMRAFRLHQSYLALTVTMFERMMGHTAAPVIAPQKDDKRFTHESWNLAYFDLLKQSYLLTSNWLMESVAGVKGLSAADQAKVSFYTQQFVDAMSPSNYLLTNPEALSTALSTQGQSLLEGVKNMLADMQRGKIAMTDYEKFKPGETIAVSKGSVVFKNRLIELIQYSPTTKQVYEKPLLICPPWINRYYILDLQPQNSLVKFLTDQGYQVFMVSWKNPDASYRDTTFEDYISEGLFAALDATRSISGQESVNTVGYCIGGSMLGTALAVMEAKKDKRVNSATFLTTLMDFADAGELTLFTDEAQLQALDAQMQRDGFLDGKSMATTFSMLRSNDLIWSFVVNNYLLGKQPFPFDILYWNHDSTRMPAAMHSWYLRNFYLENKLAQPNALTVLGTPVNLATISVPMYMVTGVSDHITPWASCYKPFAKMASKSKRFILGKAGHVAGVACPPTPEGKPVKRSYWVGEASAPTGKAWQETAQEKPDSWWTDYAEWLTTQSGKKVDAPTKQGNAAYKPLYPAPGTYVLEK